MPEAVDRPSSTNGRSAGDSQSPPNKARVFVATMFVVGGASLLAQLLAISTPRLADIVTLGAANGPGLIAIVSGWVMAARCRSWEAWKKWIWLPTAIGILAVLIVMEATAQSIEKETEAVAAEQAQIAAECSGLQERLIFQQSKIIELRATIDEAVAATASRRAFNEAIGREAPSWDQPGSSPISTSPFTAEGQARSELAEVTAEHDRIFSRFESRC